MGAGLTSAVRSGLGLRARILLIALAVLVVATTGAIGTASYLFFERMMVAQQSHAEAVANNLHVQLQRLFSLGIPLEQLQGFEEQCRQAVQNNHGFSVAKVISTDGRILFHSDPAVGNQAQVHPAIRTAIAASLPHLRDDGSETVYTFLPLESDIHGRVGTIAVGFPFALVNTQRDSLIAASLVVSVTAIGVGMLLLLLALRRYVIQPISRLVTATEALRPSDTESSGKRLPETDLFEFAVMARGFNRLLDRVEEHESALRQAKDLAVAANRAKTSFLAKMSHELRTPMTAIMGFTDLLVKKVREPKPLEYLERMREAEKRLLAIIADVLDLSSIESERLRLNTQAMSVVSVVEEQVSLIERSAQDKGLELMVDVAPALAGRVVLGDSQRIGQVLLNLLGNAIKFTSKGVIALRVSVEHEETGGNVEVLFEVEDTGMGVASRDHERVFQSFEQADNSATRRYGGTGLGLAISKRLVELMDGRIGVVSEAGRGSVFWFVLPCAPVHGEDFSCNAAPRHAPADEPKPPVRFVDQLALIVEDDPVNRTVIADLLAEVGLEVEFAEDGRQALEKVDPKRHAIVLMDLHMPHLDGIGAATEMRKRADLAKLPILALTADVYKETRQRCLGAGMNDVITKPVDADQFYRTLDAWLDTGRKRSTPAAGANAG